MHNFVDSADNGNVLLNSTSISALQRVYLHVRLGGVYQQWRFVNVNWPWFSLEQRATGEVLDGAGNESNSMQGGISAYECDKYILYLSHV